MPWVNPFELNFHVSARVLCILRDKQTADKGKRAWGGLINSNLTSVTLTRRWLRVNTKTFGSVGLSISRLNYFTGEGKHFVNVNQGHFHKCS